MKENYQLWLDHTLDSLSRQNRHPRLLLHSCCAPCSSYVLEYLCTFFDITLLFYNPNISPEHEFQFRKEELARLLEEMPLAGRKIELIEGTYSPQEFLAIAQGHEKEAEGGVRCFACYRLRLEYTARYAQEHHFDFFTTTLSISPYKNAAKLNEIGSELAEKYGVPYLFSDFKKKNGYKRSCILSSKYHLYRQDYCGCVFSRAEAEKRKKMQK